MLGPERFGAKPSIPVERPIRRKTPDIPNPIPEKMPFPEAEPAQPIQLPSEPIPVPAGR